MSVLELFLLLFLSLTLSLLAFVYFYFIHNSYSHYCHYRSQNIPTAPYIPITGHLPSLFHYDQQNNQLGFWRQPHTPHTRPLYALNLGPNQMLTINDAHYLFDLTKRRSSHLVKSAATRMYLEPSAGSQNLPVVGGSGT